jgi:acyl-CoA reductase-like NAD-dependent aldehyde dehydrogenase
MLGQVACAETSDLEEVAAAAERGFAVWKRISAFDRYKTMRKAAQLLRDRVEHVARLMTLEQGKPLAEARMEIMAGADTIDWFAEEGRRAYGRVIPARQHDVYQLVIKEPVGPVAAFTPWNFPINQIVRKLSSALAAGCSIIVKAPEETPASPAELIRAFIDAGVPAGVVNLVYGDPAHISSYLIAHPAIRKISFTGSTPVGKQLAAMAGLHMKRMTMEMGPLANPRRMSAMQNLVEDSQQQHAHIKTGGKRLGSSGNFWAATVITELPTTARAMTEEPFGPMALINPFASFEDAVREANRLPFGLAAYAWTRSARTAQQIAASIETGMITINHLGLGMPETPFGGVKDSGYGSEGGTEALEAYMNPKFVSQAGLL